MARGLPGYADEQRRVLAVKFGELCVLDLYVPNGAEVNSEKHRYKLEWFSHLHKFIQQLMSSHAHIIILGDLNIASEDRDIHDPEAWQGKVLVSPKERREFSRLLEHGMRDCFRLFEQAPQSFSWWEYRAASFRRNRGLRIDHILADTGLAKRCKACRINRAPRKLERPSDHTPVIAEFAL